MARTTLLTQVTRPQPVRAKLRPSGVAPMPPMPADQSRTCRWCRGSMWRAADGQAFCQIGCEHPASPLLYDCTCEDCGRAFQTGLGPNEFQCWECDGKEHASLVRAYAHDPAAQGYTADMRRKGASREALAIKAERER